MDKQIYFLSFYTTGDGAPDLTDVANKVKTKLSKYFTSMFIYNKETLKKLPDSEDICNVFDEPTDMTYFPYAHTMGYYDWKAFIVDYTLKQIPENSILLYHDINFEKYPNYWESDWNNIYEICEYFLNKNESDIWAKFELGDFYLRKSMKTYAIDKVFTDPEQNDVIKNSLQINSSQVILRNTLFSKEFAKEWLEYSRDWDITHPTPNPNRHPESELIGCPDQDAMQCVIYKRIFDGRLKPTFPIYGLNWRVLRLDKVKFEMKGMMCETGPYELINEEVIKYFKNK
jgi:hypothetical protein